MLRTSIAVLYQSFYVLEYEGSKARHVPTYYFEAGADVEAGDEAEFVLTGNEKKMPSVLGVCSIRCLTHFSKKL